MAKVLIVEDDAMIGRGMADHLRSAGSMPMVVDNGETGPASLATSSPTSASSTSCCRVDGWHDHRDGAHEGIGTPIVVVSARGTEQDRVRALEMGADDYLVKPFAMRELVARVRAARGSRCGSRPRQELHFEELRSTRATSRLHRRRAVELTPTEFKLLHALGLGAGNSLRATSSCSGSGDAAIATATEPSTCSSASYARRSTARALRHTFIQTRYGVGGHKSIRAASPVERVAPGYRLRRDEGARRRGRRDHRRGHGATPRRGRLRRGQRRRAESRALARLRYEQPDVCVLDLMLPGVDGWK